MRRAIKTQLNTHLFVFDILQIGLNMRVTPASNRKYSKVHAND